MTQSPLVTLVDSDPKGLATLTYSFESEQFRVVGSPDPAMAGELVRSTGARIVVVSLRAPEQAGLQLIAEVAEMGTAHGPPVIALGPPGARQAALEAGAADYLDTPAFVRDAVIISRLRLLARLPAGQRAGTPEIAGALDAMHGLFALMRAMAAAQRSGVLQLARGNRKAEVRFTDGAVSSAQLRGLQAYPALHQLLLWNGAELNLKLRDVPRRPQFSATGTEILEECERFLRDVHHAVRQFGASFDSVFARDARRGGSQATPVPEEVAPVARLFDGARTLAEVIEDSPYRIFDTLRVVKRLLEGGGMIARSVGSGAAGAIAGRSAPAPAPATARARTRSEPQALASEPAPARDLDALLQDRRGTGAGDRRRIVRRTPSGFAKPAAKPAPAPIPLVTKKSSSGAVAAGEIRSPRVMQPTPARPSPAARREPSVQIEAPTLSLDVRVPTGAFPMTDGPAPPPPVAAPVAPAETASRPAPASHPAPAPHPAPLSARQPAAPIRLKKVTKTPGAGAPAATAFNALEADFFAREADLYKDQGPDTFEDLEHGNEARRRPPTATPRGTKKR